MRLAESVNPQIAIHPAEVPDARPFGLRVAAWAGLAVLTTIWTVMTRDAWRLRTIVNNYEAIHGDNHLLFNPWPEHLQVFHDELLAVGADYYYPFAYGMIIAIGMCWIGMAVLATVQRERLRSMLLAVGASAVIAELVVLGPALTTYMNVTD